MGETVVRGVLVTFGVITATPVFALGGPGALEFAYGIGIPEDPMLLALLQHRGVLQAALGAALVWSAFRPAVRVPVAVTAIATKASFLALMATLPDSAGLDAAAGASFDVVAIVFLLVVVIRQTRAARAAAPRTGPA